MDIILLETVRGLGALGQEVKAKNGYARNYLIPQGKAVPANDHYRSIFKQKQEDLLQQESKLLQAAKEQSERLSGATIQLMAFATEEGRLFGSISAADVAKALSEQLNVMVDRKDLQFRGGAIRALGTYELHAYFHGSQVVSFFVEVLSRS